jgi:four helix bundle protein
MRDYTKIQAWQLADDLTVSVYGHTRRFPKEEIYSLTSQLRRAAYSVPSNIAEGATRESKKDYLHFLYIARASLTETQYFIHLAQRLEYLDEDEHARMMTQVKSVFERLHGLIKAVEQEAGIVGRARAVLSSLVVTTLLGAFR